MSQNFEKIVQDNKLINAIYPMTTNEMKVFYLTLAQVDTNDTKLGTYSITANQLKNSLKIDNNLYRTLKSTMHKITTRNITIEEKDTKSIISFPLVEYVKYTDSEGILDIKFSNKFAPYVIQLSREFTQIDLCKIAPLKSNFSIRMYGLLKQYQTFNRRDFSLTELKNKLGVSKKYKLYADFKRYVLNVAKKELKENTDITFEYEEIKKGRKVEKIRFKILYAYPSNKSSKDNNVLNDISPSEALSLKDSLLQFGFDENEISDLLQTHQAKKIINSISYTISRSESTQIYNLKAYFKKILEDGIASNNLNKDNFVESSSDTDNQDYKLQIQRREKGIKLYEHYKSLQYINQSFEEWVMSEHGLKVKKFKAYGTLFNIFKQHEGYEIVE